MGRVKLTNEMAKAISERIDELIQREGELTIEEVIRELGGTVGPSIVMRAVDRYPPKWAYWDDYRKSFMKRKVPREEPVREKKKVEEIRVELRPDEEIKKVEEEARKGEEERTRSLVERIEEVLGREGGGSLVGVAEKVGESPSAVAEAWRKHARNPFVTLKDDTFTVDTYAAMAVVNKICDIARERRLVTVHDLSQMLHVSEDAIRGAWRLCRHLGIRDVEVNGELVKAKRVE